MKKLFVLILAFAMLFSLSACGESGTATGDEAEAMVDEIMDQADDVVGDVVPGATVELVELSSSSDYTAENKFTLGGLQADILTDSAVSGGCKYFYSEGTQSETESLEWEKADGTYTSCEITFDLTNLEENMTETFTDCFQGVIVYNPPETFTPETDLGQDFVTTLKNLAADNEGCEVFSLTPLQVNPGQTDLNGKETKSADGVLLAKDESAKQCIICDVSEAFLRSWESNGSDEEMWAYFSYGSDVIFAVNLRSCMVDAKDVE